MGAHFEALDEGVLLVPLDPRYTQVGFNLISVQVCFSFFFHFYSLSLSCARKRDDLSDPEGAVGECQFGHMQFLA